MKKNIFAAYFLLFIIIIASLFFVTDEASASQIGVTLTLDKPTATAKVDTGYHCITTFRGIVYCNRSVIVQNYQTVTVKLEADAGDWVASTSPEEIEFDKDSENSAAFQVIVRAPDNTSSSITRNVTISGSYVVEPGGQINSIEPIKGTVLIQPCIILSVDCPNPCRKAKGGERSDFQISIRNEGNVDATALICIAHEEYWKDEGFNIEIPNEEVTIKEGGIRDIDISITIPDIVREKVSHFTIDVKSKEEYGSGPEICRYSLFVEVESDGIDDLTEDYSYLLIICGIIILISLIVCLVSGF